jgi:tetratricopeptide (TPR) repeat protein
MKFLLYKISLIFGLTIILATFASAQSERDEGIELYKKENYKEAINVLQKASKQKETKTDAEVWNYLGLAYLKDNDTKKAIKALEKAVNFNASNATYQTNLAYAYLFGNKINKAQEESAKAIALNPQNADAYYIRGYASFLEDKSDEAINDADKAIGINPIIHWHIF